jgi:hypothetical protein
VSGTKQRNFYTPKFSVLHRANTWSKEKVVAVRERATVERCVSMREKAHEVILSSLTLRSAVPR